MYCRGKINQAALHVQHAHAGNRVGPALAVVDGFHLVAMATYAGVVEVGDQRQAVIAKRDAAVRVQKVWLMLRASEPVFAEELPKARLKAGLTQEEVAARAGVSREYDSMLESGKNLPTGGQMVAVIAKRLYRIPGDP